MEARESPGRHVFSCRSLLLSTTVLNDYSQHIRLRPNFSPYIYIYMQMHIHVLTDESPYHWCRSITSIVASHRNHVLTWTTFILI